MDFSSNDFILVVVAVVVIILIRTLILASKQINSSEKFPTSKNHADNKAKDKNPPSN